MSKKGHVLLGMSGGLDSSVAALLLKNAGYKVTGLTLRTYDHISTGCEEKQTGCCTIDSIYDAKILMESLSFDHIVMDVRDDFRNSVIDNFITEYINGRTPNPCALCNPGIKWEYMLSKAAELGCDFVATGHYAGNRKNEDRYVISEGTDKSKDQSYFLWGLTQEALARTIFPLGRLLKTEVREIARKNKLVKLSQKKESQEICFIPDNDYRNFLKSNVIGFETFFTPGNYKSIDGKILGRHKGFPYYTIGQRKGLEIAVGHPLYVIEINPEKNEVILGTREDLARESMIVGHINPVKYKKITSGMKVYTKIRYRSKAIPSVLQTRRDKLLVKFNEDVHGVTPGQSAVFYEGEDMVGGGIIMRGY